MFDDFFDRLAHEFRACLWCSRFVFVRRSLFCRDCEIELFKTMSPQKETLIFEGNSIACFYLFPWIPNENILLSKLLTQLKGGRLPLAFDFYGQKLVQMRVGHSPLLEKIILVPAPSADPQRDHAMSLAKAVAKHCQIPLASVLRSVTEEKMQKTQSRQQRRSRRFAITGQGIGLRDTHSLVFIDDIVTTGATAETAWRALGRPDNFEVWCLARRGLLAASHRV